MSVSRRSVVAAAALGLVAPHGRSLAQPAVAASAPHAGDAGRVLEEVRRQVRQIARMPERARAARGVGWSNVAIGGCGYITGLLLHPAERDLVYAKIDIGGVFRWEPRSRSWTSLMDFLPIEQWNDYGTESVAIDPSDPDVLYVATGNYDQEWADEGKIYRSTDRGCSWTRISPQGWGVRCGGGQFRRGTGERLAVSPHRSEVVLFASRRSGLWRSEDRGASWQQQTFDGLNADLGIQSLLFDPKTPGLVYGTFNGLGMYRSTDDGRSWARIEGGPTVGMRMALTSVPGELWVTYDEFPGLADGGVAKLAADGTWTTTYPAGAPIGAYNAIAVDPFDDRHLLAAPGETYQPGTTYRSRDGGHTWTTVDWTFDSTVPFVQGTGRGYGDAGWFLGEQAAFVFDPHRRGTFWMSNWFFTSRCEDIAAEAPTLTSLVAGQETTVALSLATNASGQLVSGMADVGGFLHDNGTAAYPSGQHPALEGQTPLDGQVYPWNATTGAVAFAGDRDVVFRAGSVRGIEMNGLARSDDGGRSWRLLHEWDAPEGSVGKPLRVVVSATDADNLLVTRFGAPTQYTRDGGGSWADSTGAAQTPANEFFWGQPVVADGATAATFYSYDDTAATVSRSDDGGATFRPVADGLVNSTAGDRRGYLDATPGVAGELWLCLEDAGLHLSTDAGESWQAIGAVTQARNLAVGPPAEPGMPATLYLYGKVAGEQGIWMSLDRGRTWTDIQQAGLEIGTGPNTMEASQVEFGQVFVGTSGRGVFRYALSGGRS
ncbi:MAG: WD40/YVTN/BNR-like repeat-containing protein [Dermatophilaceae bacterium]